MKPRVLGRFNFFVAGVNFMGAIDADTLGRRAVMGVALVVNLGLGILLTFASEEAS